MTTTSESQLTCGKEVFTGFTCCKECIEDLICSNIDSQRNSDPTTYSNQKPTNFSQVQPEKGKCQYKMMRGEWRGWYCASNCKEGFDFCEGHIERILSRLNYGKRDCGVQSSCVRSKQNENPTKDYRSIINEHIC